MNCIKKKPKKNKTKNPPKNRDIFCSTNLLKLCNILNHSSQHKNKEMNSILSKWTSFRIGYFLFSTYQHIDIFDQKLSFYTKTLSHVGFLFCYNQRTSQLNLVWYKEKCYPTANKLYASLWSFYCWLWTSKCRLDNFQLYHWSLSPPLSTTYNIIYLSVTKKANWFLLQLTFHCYLFMFILLVYSPQVYFLTHHV